MYKTIVMTAVTLFFFACSSLYADSDDTYAKIGFASINVKKVEGTDFGTRKYSYDRGMGLQLAYGYDYDIWSVEGEYAYSTSDNDSVEIVDENRSVTINGYQDIHSLMLNAYYHSVEFEGFTPYIGIGFGFSMVIWESSNINVKDSAFTLTSQVMLGGSYEITDNMAISLEGKRRMLQSYTMSGVGSVMFDHQNEVFLSLIYRLEP